jgi:magnesium-protoporphyrin O-methyltransferase
MGCCGFTETVDQQFTTKLARRELADYQRSGAGATARLLRDALSDAGLASGTLIDVGGGVGALSFDLMQRGMRRSTIVEASAAYAVAALQESRRRGHAATTEIIRGDFVEVAPDLPAADVVTLDRVVCCYPLFRPLLEAAAGHALRAVAVSYPRDHWPVRGVVRLENWARRRRSGFQTFVHSVADMRAMLADYGFALVDQRGTLFWGADVFARR